MERKKALILALLVLGAPPAWGAPSPSNYPECLLQELPGADNDVIARHIAASCAQRFPTAFGAPPSPGRFPDGRSCVLVVTKDTKSALAATLLERSCFALYGPAAPGGLQPFRGKLDDEK